MNRLQKWGAVLAVLVAINLALAGLLYSSYISGGPDPLVPRRGFAPDMVHEPVLSSGDPNRWEASPTVVAGLAPTYSLEGRWETSLAYAGWGGELRFWLKNTGRTDIFVYGFRLDGDWCPPVLVTVGLTIPPGEESCLGLLHFSGPAKPGLGSYTLRTGLQVRAALSGPGQGWYDFGYVGDTLKTINFLPLGKVPTFTEIKNPAYYFDKANQLMDPKDPAVVRLADQIRANFSGPCSIFQAAAAFDWVHDNITYKAEPAGQDYWQPPAETLRILTGDCEDYALLLSAVITAMNGTTRFEVEDDHAFLSVYAGTDLALITDSLSRYYNTDIRVAAFHDGYGWWLSADATDAMFLGALPLGGTPLAHGWGLTNTTVHYLCDMIPD